MNVNTSLQCKSMNDSIWTCIEIHITRLAKILVKDLTVRIDLVNDLKLLYPADYNHEKLHISAIRLLEFLYQYHYISGSSYMKIA